MATKHYPSTVASLWK